MPRSLAQRVGAPVVVRGNDRLAVALGGEHGAVVGRQLCAQLEVVVDLPVEDQHVAVRRFRRSPAQRLVGVLDVDDREPVEPEHHVVVVPGPGLIGSAVPRIMCDAPDTASLPQGRVGEEPADSSRSRASSPHTAPVCRTRAERVRRLAPLAFESRSAFAPALRGGLRCVVFALYYRASRRLRRRDTSRTPGWWHVAPRTAASWVARRLLLSGCSWSEALGLGWPEGITPQAACEPRVVDRFADRGTGDRRDRLGPDVLGLIVSPPQEIRHRAAAPIRLQHAARAGPHRDAVLIISVLFYFTVVVQERMLHKDPNPEVVVDVTAFQWNWEFGYQRSTSPTARSPTTVPTMSARRPWSPGRRAWMRTARNWSERCAG